MSRWEYGRSSPEHRVELAGQKHKRENLILMGNGISANSFPSRAPRQQFCSSVILFPVVDDRGRTAYFMGRGRMVCKFEYWILGWTFVSLGCCG